jgi:hypothetical protein
MDGSGSRLGGSGRPLGPRVMRASRRTRSMAGDTNGNLGQSNSGRS